MPTAGTFKVGSLSPAGGAIVNIASSQGSWVVAHDDLEASADSAANMLKPWNISKASMHWVKIPEGATRVWVRARMDATASVVTTSPIVKLMGANGTLDATNATFSGTSTAASFAQFTRVDDSADDAGSGQTLTLATTGLLEDASYEYSNKKGPYDCVGCSHVAILVATAANVTDGTVAGQLKFTN